MTTQEPGAGTTGAEAADGQEPGTTAEAQAGGQEPESAAEVARLKAENERLARLHEEHLREKSNLEAERARYREIEAAQANQQSPAGQAQSQQFWARVVQDANDPDSPLHEYAQGMLAMGREVLNQRAQVSEQFGYMEVPPEKRPDVQRAVAEARQRGEYITPKTAAQLIDGRNLSTKADELARREKELTEREAAIRGGQVSTREVPAPPDPSKLKTMTQKEYGKRMAEYRQKGDDAAADALYLAKERGEISIT
jgi:hypothetical protein